MIDGPVIRFRRLCKRYGRRRALGGIDLDLAGRQVVGVVGPDGAGKTTFLRSITGLLEIEADEASVLGFDLREDVTELKARIGYVPQSFSLQGEMSILENFRFTARLHRLDRETFEARAGELLERTGLAPFRDRPVARLSGGMKQKLAVANALLPRPDLLVLDEPTAGVDVVARGEIADMLARERKHALVVMSTSYLDEAEDCDRLVYLDRGLVVATGTPGELRSRVSTELYRVWGAGPRMVARLARDLPYVRAARATGPFVRVEVDGEMGPGPARVVDELRRLEGTDVWLVEPVATDMESTLLALAGHGDTP